MQCPVDMQMEGQYKIFDIRGQKPKEKQPSHSHNSPEYCPCPLVPRKSACSVTVHCCGCRGPSPLRCPVEPLEEAVPEELWPPGEGKEGLLYGRQPSSGRGNRSRDVNLSILILEVTSTSLH